MRPREVAYLVTAATAGIVVGRALAIRDEIRMDGWGLFWSRLATEWLCRDDEMRRIERKLDELNLLIRQNLEVPDR